MCCLPFDVHVYCLYKLIFLFVYLIRHFHKIIYMLIRELIHDIRQGKTPSFQENGPFCTHFFGIFEMSCFVIFSIGRIYHRISMEWLVFMVIFNTWKKNSFSNDMIGYTSDIQDMSDSDKMTWKSHGVNDGWANK